MGGAELSNLQVIKAGIELGFYIKIITPASFDRDWIAQSDFLIFNNFYMFEGAVYHFILKVIWEYKKPYMIYSHDHRDIIGEETARHRFARSWFGHSFCNVFISPMHKNNFLKHLGECIEPSFILTPPIDVDFFKPVNGVDRILKSAVNLTGRLVSSKGLLNVYNWAIANPDYTLSIYTKYADGTSGKLLAARPNVKLFSSVPYKMLPRIYSESHYVIHFPVALEAAGRTLIEGTLCGCQVLMNDNVGVASFTEKELPLKDIPKLRKIIRRGPYEFWYKVIKFHSSLHLRKWSYL